MRISISVQVVREQRGSRPARRKLVAAALALAVLLPGVALASHTFTDVPTSSTFHNAIARVFGARITTGCSATLYCPKDPVSREQMAAFINRSAGRAAANTSQVMVPDTEAFTDVASLTITPGNVGGGTAIVVVTAQTYAYTVTSGVCPCTLVTRLKSTGDLYGVHSFTVMPDVGQSWGGTTYRLGNTSNTWAFQVPTGVEGTYTVQAAINSASGGSLTAHSALTAVYTPFGPNGGNDLFLPTLTAPVMEGLGSAAP